MSRIDELIRERCPDGVPYRSVGSLASVGTGSSDRKDAVEDGAYPFYVRSKEVLRKDSYEFDEEAILIPGEGGVGDIFHYVNGKYALHQRAYRLAFKTDEVVAKYAYYYFCANFKKFILARAVNATVTSIRKPMLTDFLIAIPPPEVQGEIVRILDLFTSLEAELKAELAKRRQQYAHYRDALFTFPDPGGVRWATMGEVAVNLDARRRPVTKSAREPGDIPYYGASGIVDYVSDYIFDGDFLLVSEDGANLLTRSTPIAFTASGKTWINNHAHVLEFGTYIERRFVEIYLNSIDLSSYVSGGAQPKLNQANLNRIPVPQPEFVEQERIVGIIDKLDALVNDLHSGLPAEIDARRQQYEYYRDKLLTFEEAVA